MKPTKVSGTANEAMECPACHKSTRDYSYIVSGGGRTSPIYSCGSCSFMFARPVPLDEMQERQMDSVEDAELFGSGFLRRLHERLIIDREIKLVRSAMKGNMALSVLDVGCGTGWTSALWKKQGIKVTGLEPSAVRADIAERRGIAVIRSYIEDLSPNAHSFDLIIMRHTLEHFEDPHRVLQKAKMLLNPGGLLLVVVPNIRCIGRYAFGTAWSWVLPWHCNFFSPRSLAAMVTTAGFTLVCEYQTPSPLWYPESFLRSVRLPQRMISRYYRKLSLLSLVPAAPLVLLGYVLRLSDNLTMIARKSSGET